MKILVRAVSFTLLGVLCMQVCVQAQPLLTMQAPMATASIGTGRLVLVPFQPHELLSDATTDIAHANNMPAADIRATLRYSMDASLFVQCNKRRSTVRLMVDSVSEGRNDLQAFYNSVKYSYQVPKEVAETRHSGMAAKLNAVAASRGTKSALRTVPIGDSKMKLPDTDTRYYAANITNTNLLGYMAEKYHADYFLFINQMEIRTRYEYCLDLASQNYEREFSIHYSLFDSKGNLLAGDVMTLYYPSNANDLESVIKDNFGLIAGYLAAQVPKQ